MQYDVFVVGARDPNPVAQMHLAAKLAEHFHAPAVQIAQAISTRNLRAGQNLDEAQARILTEQLANFGAVTELRPVVGGRTTGVHPTTQITSAPTMGGVPATRAGFQPRTMAGGTTPNPVHQQHTQGMGLAPLGLSNQTMGSGSNALGSAPRTMAAANQPGRDVVGRDPFAPPPDDRMPSTQIAAPPTGMLAAPGNMAAAMGRGGPSGGRDAFAPPTGDLPRIELATGRGPAPTHPQDSDDLMPAKRPQPSFGHDQGGGPSKLTADSDDSGVALAQDKIHMIRCTEHGLYYDKRTSSACRKCLAPSRERAAMMGKKGGPSVVGKAMKLRDDPVRHAFYGLAIALLLGLLPAAFHALAVGNPEVKALRTEQAKLSDQIGTEKAIARFQELDQQVREKHDANFRLTALIWMVGGGLGVLAWHKIT
jgi:hypothetical protein